MTKDAPAFDFYPERWLAGVADMSDGDQIAYLRLLCHQWLREGLPSDSASLSRLAGRKVSSLVIDKFPEGEDGKRRNKRLETIRQEQRDRISKASEKARKMAESRWSKSDATAIHKQCTSIPASNATAMHKECPPPTTHQSPHTSVDKSPDVEGRTQKRAAPPPADDEAWIVELEKSPAYQGISIRSELGKMQQWCQVNGKQASRRRFINWLNNARPMQVNGHKPPPKHAAYNAATATLGMSAEDIGLFTHDQK